MKQTKISFNLDGLEDMKKEIGDTWRARVGILGSHAARTDPDSGLNNAELGVIQMFGSITNNIPPRDFLLMPIKQNSQEITRAMATPSARAAFERKDYKRLFQLLGAKAEEIVQLAFESGGFGKWPPLKPATIARKGSSAILIDTGQLRRAISSDVEKKGSIK